MVVVGSVFWLLLDLFVLVKMADVVLLFVLLLFVEMEFIGLL